MVGIWEKNLGVLLQLGGNQTAPAQTAGAKEGGIIGIARALSTTLYAPAPFRACSTSLPRPGRCQRVRASATAAWEAAPTGPRRRRTRARAVSLRLRTSAAAGPVL